MNKRIISFILQFQNILTQSLPILQLFQTCDGCQHLFMYFVYTGLSLLQAQGELDQDAYHVNKEVGKVHHIHGLELPKQELCL